MLVMASLPKEIANNHDLCGGRWFEIVRLASGLILIERALDAATVSSKTHGVQEETGADNRRRGGESRRDLRKKASESLRQTKETDSDGEEV